jgi:hypothetical protein
MITACRFLHRADQLLTSSKDTLVKLWDLPTQHCVETLVAHRSEVWSLDVRYAPPGRPATGAGRLVFVAPVGVCAPPPPPPPAPPPPPPPPPAPRTHICVHKGTDRHMPLGTQPVAAPSRPLSPCLAD